MAIVWWKVLPGVILVLLSYRLLFSRRGFCEPCRSDELLQPSKAWGISLATTS